MRIRKETIYIARRNAVYLRNLDLLDLLSFHHDVDIEPYKGRYMRTLFTMINREIDRRKRML